MDHYKKSGEGGFALVDDETGETRWIDREVSICVSLESGTMFKHGQPESVNEWHQKAIQKYLDGGLDRISSGLVVVTSDRWDIEELNNFLDISGYFNAWRKLRISKAFTGTPTVY